MEKVTGNLEINVERTFEIKDFGSYRKPNRLVKFLLSHYIKPYVVLCVDEFTVTASKGDTITLLWNITSEGTKCK